MKKIDDISVKSREEQEKLKKKLDEEKLLKEN